MHRSYLLSLNASCRYMSRSIPQQPRRFPFTSPLSLPHPRPSTFPPLSSTSAAFPLPYIVLPFHPHSIPRSQPSASSRKRFLDVLHAILWNFTRVLVCFAWFGSWLSGLITPKIPENITEIGKVTSLHACISIKTQSSDDAWVNPVHILYTIHRARSPGYTWLKTSRAN